MRKTQYRLVKTRKNSYRPASKYTHKDRAKEMGFIFFIYIHKISYLLQNCIRNVALVFF